MNGRIFVSTIAFAAFLSCASAQDTHRASYQTTAKRVSEVLKDLSKTYGVTLESSTKLASEPIILSFSEQTCDDVRKQIAHAMSGEWEATSTGFRLIRSATETRKLEAAALQSRTLAVTESLKSIREKLAKAGDLTEAKARAAAEKAAEAQRKMAENISGGNAMRMTPDMEAGQTNAASLALWRMLLALSPQTLAEIGSDTRVVFALTPTRMQRALPASVRNAVQTFAVEHSRYVRAFQDQPKSALPENTHILNFGTTKPIQGSIQEALLIVYRHKSGALNVSVHFADQTGKFVSEAQEFVSVNEAPFSGSVSLNQPDAVLSFTEPSKELSSMLRYEPSMAGGAVKVRSSGQNQMVAVMVLGQPASVGARPPKPTVSAAWRSILADPFTNDPLSFSVSDGFLGVAKSEKRNLVARVSDSTLTRLGSQSLDTVTAKQWCDLAISNGHEFQVENGWMNVRPVQPLRVEAARFNRRASQPILSAAARSQRAPIDDFAAFMSSVPYGIEPDSTLGRMLGVLDTRSYHQYRSMLDQLTASQFFATMNAGRRKMIADGDGVPFMQLSPVQKEILHNLVFNDMQGPNRPDPDENGQTERRVFAFGGGGMVFGGNMDSLYHERTEYLPNGLPNQGSMKLSVSSEEAVFASSSGDGEGKFYTADEYAITQNLASSSNSEPFQGAATSDEFTMGVRNSYEILFNMPEGVTVNRYVEDELTLTGGRPTSFQQLPAEFRKRVEEARERMKVNIGGPPPPPPSSKMFFPKGL